jgi:hypothetical protein
MLVSNPRAGGNQPTSRSSPETSLVSTLLGPALRIYPPRHRHCPESEPGATPRKPARLRGRSRVVPVGA